MKQIVFLTLTILFSFAQIQAQSKKAKVDMAFDKTVEGITFHDYGSIVFGANGNVDFNFTNRGAQPLVITNVQSSCGCTVPTWPREPIEPGKQGTISIVYNTTLPGVFNKTVVVYSNANNSPVRLEVRGKVNSQASDLKPGNKINVEAGGAGNVDAGNLSTVVVEEDQPIHKRHAESKAASEAARAAFEAAEKAKKTQSGTKKK